MGFLSRSKTKKAKAEKAKEENHTEQAKSAEEQSSKDQDTGRSEEHDRARTSDPQSGAGVNQNSSSHTPPPGTPVLDRSDEAFIQNILSGAGEAPTVPEQVAVPELDWPSDDASSVNRTESSEEGSKDKEKGKNKDEGSHEESKEDGKKKKPGRLSTLFSKRKSKHGDHLKPESAAEAGSDQTEEQKEKVDLNRILDRLNLGAKNNKVINLSNESSELLTKFTQVFKDLANGVPTAYDDLVKLVSDRDGTITKCFEKLPSGLQKLVTQLPEKLTESIAPEVLAAAAKSQGIEAAAEGGMKELTQKLLMPQNLMELVTKPGALVGMLKAIVQALQARWPAFIGLNVIWSVALFILMFVLWYCYKRGREVRLEQEKAEAEAAVDGSDRIEELADDPQLPAVASTEANKEASSETGPDINVTAPKALEPAPPAAPAMEAAEVPRRTETAVPAHV